MAEPASTPATATATCLLRVPDAARYLSLSPSTLAKRRLDGTGPRFVYLGGRPGTAVAYRVSDLDAWIESRLATSTSESAAG